MTTRLWRAVAVLSAASIWIGCGLDRSGLDSEPGNGGSTGVGGVGGSGGSSGRGGSAAAGTIGTAGTSGATAGTGGRAGTGGAGGLAGTGNVGGVPIAGAGGTTTAGAGGGAGSLAQAGAGGNGNLAGAGGADGGGAGTLAGTSGGGGGQTGGVGGAVGSGGVTGGAGGGGAGGTGDGGRGGTGTGGRGGMGAGGRGGTGMGGRGGMGGRAGCERYPTAARSFVTPTDNRIHCYWPVTNTQTWSGAQQNCTQQQGHLVTILSAEENAFVVGVAQFSSTFNDVWIGGRDGKPGTDTTGPGTYSWVTGEPWSYSNWGQGEPDGFCDPCGGSQACTCDHWATLVSNGTWSDRWSDTTRAFVCEATPP